MATQDPRARRMAGVRRVVRKHLRLNGTVPSARQVARELGYQDDRVVRKDWDQLTTAGKLPPRRRALPRNGPAGQVLLTCQALLRSFMERAYLAEETERERGTAFWLDNLGKIGQLVDQGIKEVTGEALDDAVRMMLDEAGAEPRWHERGKGSYE